MSIDIDDLISGKSPDDYMEFNFDDCLVNCDGICDTCIDCDFISGEALSEYVNDPTDYISEDVIEKKIDISRAVQKQEKVLQCSKCGMHDPWNSKGKDGKYYCYKHC